MSIALDNLVGYLGHRPCLPVKPSGNQKTANKRAGCSHLMDRKIVPLDENIADLNFGPARSLPWHGTSVAALMEPGSSRDVRPRLASYSPASSDRSSASERIRTRSGRARTMSAVSTSTPERRPAEDGFEAAGSPQQRRFCPQTVAGRFRPFEDAARNPRLTSAAAPGDTPAGAIEFPIHLGRGIDGMADDLPPPRWPCA